MRLHIRGAAGQQDAIAALEQRFELEALAERRDDQRQRIRRLRDRLQVLFADAMEPVAAQQPSVGGDADDRFARTHVNYFKRLTGQTGRQQGPDLSTGRARPSPPGNAASGPRCPNLPCCDAICQIRCRISPIPHQIRVPAGRLIKS
jgi:hypothetical protein